MKHRLNAQRRQKEETVQELKEKLSTCRAVIFADYKGLNVARVTELRRQCREAGVEMRVSKNTLTRIAATEVGLADAIPMLKESTASFYSYGDPVAPAKVLDAFVKETRIKLEIRGGVVEGKIIGEDGVKVLVDLPSKEVLIAQVLSTMNAPIVGFLNVLQGNTRNLVYALEAVRKLKAENA